MTQTYNTALLVGPVIRGFDPDLAEAVLAAVERDNPDSEVMVDDQGGYVRIHTAGRCLLTRATLEDELGYTYPITRLEQALASFAGRVRTSDDSIEWYLERNN